MSLKGKKVLVGLTGGIACYKIPYLVRSLHKADAEVRVVMTRNATRFITPLTLESVANYPVAADLFPENEFVATRHIDLAEWPDLIVIAPATANFIGKVAAGISDDLLTTIICATARPVILAPAMNPGMWANKVTRRNFTFLKDELGFLMIDPVEGNMACDSYGVGRMAEPDQIFEQVSDFLLRGQKKVLEGKKIVVTAGPCREPLDPVRFISNRSSGKMGYAVAEAAVRMGATTTLISGPTDLIPPDGVKVVKIETTDELFRAVKARYSKTDCLIMAAAPADYAPANVAPEKMKKQESGLNVSLKPTVDILKTLGPKKKPGQLLVGFALETENGIRNARRKLKEKNLDLVVLNNPRDEGAAFDFDTNRVTVIRPGKKPDEWPLLSKAEVAERLLNLLVALF